MTAPRIPPVVKELVVAVDPPQAFRAFTAHVQRWWPVATHSVAGTEGRGLRLDEQGFVETLADGTPCRWGSVLVWRPPRCVAFTWHPGQPADPHTRVEVTFEAIPEGTRVRLVHSGWESLGVPDGPSERLEQYRSGWDAVLGGYVDLVAAAGVA